MLRKRIQELNERYIDLKKEMGIDGQIEKEFDNMLNSFYDSFSLRMKYNDFDHENYCVLNNKTYAELFEELDEVGLKEYVEHYTEFLNEIEEKKESIVKVLEALNEYSGGVNRSIYRILSFISSLERYRKREDTEMDWWEVGSFLIDNDIPHENNFNDICVLVLGQEIVPCQEDDELYIRSATAGDYSPSCPWNAPGMCISNFI